MSQKLTERGVKALRPSPDGEPTVWDSELPRFGVRVLAATKLHPQGTKSFFINYRADGRETRLSIGKFPGWSVEAARIKAKELLRRVDSGENPAAEKRERRLAPTVADLAERYRTEHLPKKVKSSQKGDWAMIEKEILPRLGSRRVADVHHGDTEAMHREITVSGRAKRANRVLACASKMFALSLKPMEGETVPWRDAAQGNPCRGIERNPEEGRENFLSEAQLAALSDGIAAYGPKPAGNCIALIMLTGCRPGEAMVSRWEEFDAEPGFWIKPSAHTKQRRAHKVPLGPAAIQLLAKLRATRGDSPFVFPGRIHGRPLAFLHTAWSQICKAAGLTDVRIYDLRHTFASIGAGSGLSLQIIGRLLGHTQARTTMRYAHLGDDPLREAASRITAQIANAGKPAAEIFPLPKRGGAA